MAWAQQRIYFFVILVMASYSSVRQQIMTRYWTAHTQTSHAALVGGGGEVTVLNVTTKSWLVKKHPDRLHLQSQTAQC